MTIHLGNAALHEGHGFSRAENVVRAGPAKQAAEEVLDESRRDVFRSLFKAISGYVCPIDSRSPTPCWSSRQCAESRRDVTIKSPARKCRVGLAKLVESR
jgi:hypothetical protein